MEPVQKTVEKLTVDGDTISFVSPFNDSWTMQVDALAIFGEFTNEQGPYLDDYFLVFITRRHESYVASFYSDGRDKFLKELGSRLGIEFECRLVGSTSLDSNVLWPQDIANQPLYEFAEKTTAGLGTIVLRWIGIVNHKAVATFSPPVMAKLRERT